MDKKQAKLRCSISVSVCPCVCARVSSSVIIVPIIRFGFFSYSPLLIIVFRCLDISTHGRYYTIVAPESIRQHSDYQISITLHNEFNPATMRFAIEDGLQYRIDKTVTISSNRSELITLHIDALDVSKGYKFVAEGLAGIRFRNESQLRIQSKNTSIFIQTDKTIYKPAESIRFRILVLDGQLRPVTLAADDRLNIHVTDSEKNRIRQWVNVTTTKGVFTGEIQLSEQPVLGDWTISTKIGNEVIDVISYNERPITKLYCCKSRGTLLILFLFYTILRKKVK